MIRIRSNSWMQSTGQTSKHERSLMSMQGYSREQAVNQLRSPLCERRFRHHLIEAGLVRATQPGRVRVIREAEDRRVRIRVRDVVWINTGHVGDNAVRRVRAVRRDQMMGGEGRLELPSQVEIDPNEQDRRHSTPSVTLC
jgi:hypothetical protein